MTQQTQRLFIALNLPAELRTELYDATRAVRDAAPDGSWARADNLHLTLKFLGQRPASELDRLRDLVANAASGCPPIRLVIQGVGAFPNLRRARVVWLGVEPERHLELLQHDLETGGAALGYEVEGRPFRPHLTLGRLREADREQLRALARAAARVKISRTVEVETLDLMQSEPGTGGSRYTVLAAEPLRNR